MRHIVPLFQRVSIICARSGYFVLCLCRVDEQGWVNLLLLFAELSPIRKSISSRGYPFTAIHLQ